MSTVEQFPRDGGLWIDPRDRAALGNNDLTSLRAWMDVPGDGSLDKHRLASWRERVVLQLEAADGSTTTLYIKRFQNPPWRARLRRRLAGFHSFAEQEWHWLRRLAQLHIPAARPVAGGADCAPFAEQHSCVVLEEVPGEALERWLPRQASGLTLLQRRTLCSAVSQLVRGLHGHGLFHRDLYLAHIFVDPQPDGAWHLFLIDLQRAVAPSAWRRRRWAVKDLAALNYSSPPDIVSRTERLRWLKQYLDVTRLRPRDRRLIRDVAAKTARMGRHSRKHGLEREAVHRR